jgi:hypothetical protein
MIREALSSHNTSNGHASPATEPKELEGGKLQKLGEKLGNAASTLGEKLGVKSDQVNEIMIGMFMHTPWPSSEIFRCLPSTSSHFLLYTHVRILTTSPKRDPGRNARRQHGHVPNILLLSSFRINLYPSMRFRILSRRSRIKWSIHSSRILSHRNRYKASLA